VVVALLPSKVLGLGSAPLVDKSSFKEDMMPSDLCLSHGDVCHGRINRNGVKGVAMDQSMHHIKVQLLKRGGCVHAGYQFEECALALLAPGLPGGGCAFPEMFPSVSRISGQEGQDAGYLGS
jgi:hypothetical protein